jgi:hypothetical protein
MCLRGPGRRGRRRGDLFLSHDMGRGIRTEILGLATPSFFQSIFLSKLFIYRVIDSLLVPVTFPDYSLARVSSQLIWRLRTRSGGTRGGFSFDLARRRLPVPVLAGLGVRSQWMWQILTACAGDLASLSCHGKLPCRLGDIA